MRIPGERVKRLRLVKTERYIVEVEVEAVRLKGDSDDVCYESEVVELLREVEQHARAGDVAWLLKRGRVYAVVDAA